METQQKCTMLRYFQKIPVGKVLAEKLGGAVRPAFQNRYPIYDQNLQYSLPYLWPDHKFEILFMTWPLN